MANDIIFEQEARKQIFSGIEKVAKAKNFIVKHKILLSSIFLG